jgi:hypothetical protein
LFGRHDCFLRLSPVSRCPLRRKAVLSRFGDRWWVRPLVIVGGLMDLLALAAMIGLFGAIRGAELKALSVHPPEGEAVGLRGFDALAPQRRLVEAHQVEMSCSIASAVTETLYLTLYQKT